MAPTSWIVPPDRRLVWREWDEHSVVFNPSSGDTHFLNALAREVLRRLETEPATIDGVVHHLERLAETKLEPDAIEQIRLLVAKLDDVGLIERYQP